jgi:hypothetical protein
MVSGLGLGLFHILEDAALALGSFAPSRVNLAGSLRNSTTSCKQQQQQEQEQEQQERPLIG